MKAETMLLVLQDANVYKTNKIGNVRVSQEDPIRPQQLLHAVYRISCRECNLCCIGETKRSFQVWRKEHQTHVRKNLLGKNKLTWHVFDSDYTMDCIKSKILEREKDFCKPGFLESSKYTRRRIRYTDLFRYTDFSLCVYKSVNNKCLFIINIRFFGMPLAFIFQRLTCLFILFLRGVHKFYW